MRNSSPTLLAFLAMSIFAIFSLVPVALPRALNFTGAAAEDDVSTEIIIRSLKSGTTRGLNANKAPNDGQLQGLIEKGKKRGLNLQERDELFELSNDKGQIDIPVYFDLGSAEITSRAKGQLDKLGDALSEIEFERDTFLVGGHTDRRGSRSYNQALSERRAKAVRTYLLRNYDIEPDALVAVGFGYEQLKDPQDPLAAENRRVQLVNITR